MSQFQHSVRVPRLYKVAATVAKQYSESVASIKQLVYGEKKKHPNLKAIFSMVTTLFQKSREIEILLKRSQILEKESRCDPWLIKILIVELLWGKRALVGQSKPENTVRGYEQIFKAHLTDQTTDKTEGPHKPRYVRVNTLLLPTEEAVQKFQDEEWVLSKFLDKNDYEGFLKKISILEEGEFIVDLHIPDLLIFPPRTEFHNHPAYQKGSILLQDKASCLPVHILAPPPGSVALDMCAAPGMKTTHLAAIMKDKGTVYAVEKDPKRYKTLEEMISSSAATCVKTFNKDVLDCSAEDFPGVEYILVDPSCSGTGIAERYYNPEEISHERLQKLAGFQIKILRSALTRYPDVKRVVYSTCSLKPEENEDVVRQVIETNFKFKLVPAKQFITGNWKNFGSQDYGELGAYCLYTRPDDDFTNGFFVAVFERLAEAEQNKFFNNKIYSYKRSIDKKERRKQKKLERERRENEQNQQNIDGDISDTEIAQDASVSGLEEHINHNGQSHDQTCDLIKKKSKKKKNSEKDKITSGDDEKAVQENVEILESLDEAYESVKIKKKKKKDKHCEEASTANSQDMVHKFNSLLTEDSLTGVTETCEAKRQKKKKKEHTEINILTTDDTEVVDKCEEFANSLENNFEGIHDLCKIKKKKKKQYSETTEQTQDPCQSFEKTFKENKKKRDKEQDDFFNENNNVENERNQQNINGDISDTEIAQDASVSGFEEHINQNGQSHDQTCELIKKKCKKKKNSEKDKITTGDYEKAVQENVVILESLDEAYEIVKIKKKKKKDKHSEEANTDNIQDMVHNFSSLLTEDCLTSVNETCETKREKKKKKKHTEINVLTTDDTEVVDECDEFANSPENHFEGIHDLCKIKKKKKKKHTEATEQTQDPGESFRETFNENKKKDDKEQDYFFNENNNGDSSLENKKRKKKKAEVEENLVELDVTPYQPNDLWENIVLKKKKKKRKTFEITENDDNTIEQLCDISESLKKNGIKKKRKHQETF